MIQVNGKSSKVRAGETVAALLLSLGLDLAVGGVAVAVDEEVVPRSSWGTFTLPENARVEVLTAMQGG